MGLQDSIARNIAKMSICNLVTGDFVEAQFNPTELEEQIRVNWERLAVTGLSHQPLHYVQTENYKISLELFFRAESVERLAGLDFDKRFLASLCYPQESEDTRGGPPRVLLVWPKVINMVVVFRTLRFTNTRFNHEGSVVELLAKIEMEEIRDARLNMTDAFGLGARRPPSGTENP